LKRLELPPEEGALRALTAGDDVELFGDALTMRDAALERLAALIEAGEQPPFDLAGQLVFYAGPAPPTADRPTGAIGPTTSARMDRYLHMLFELGVRATLGKGPRSEEVRQLHKDYGAVYLAAVGGVGALFATRVESLEVLAWDDLGPEAVHRVSLFGLPAVVAIDAGGADHLDAQYRTHGQGLG